ncbi:hypothetical protein GD604_14945 [Desulfolutivibrio sulfoxidireducens]|nr:hypothetical protein GD604_14945 [Desulfolutivibrio sulfoxidireducens]
MSAWRALEEVSGLALAAMDWRRSYGLNLAALGRYLRPTDDLAESLDCPATPGGLHTVVHHEPGDIVGVCDHCPTEKLSKADIVIQRLHVQSLCKDIATALGLSPGFESQALGHYFIGELVPNPGTRYGVYLCCRGDPEQLESAALHLTSTGKRGFILLTPTNRYWTARLRSSIETATSYLMSLEEVVDLADKGFSASAGWRSFLDIRVPRTTTKAPPTTFPTPHGARWNELTIRFLTGDTASVTIRDARLRVSYTDMGMARSDNANRSVQWEMLERFAKGNGYYEPQYQPYKEREKQQVSRLGRALKVYFKIDGEPIVRDGQGWKTAFVIRPEGWEEPEEESWQDL